MMLKQKSSPWARLKYLYVLPLTAVAVVAFARPEISRELEKISSVKISEIVPVKEVIAPKKTEPMADVVPDSPVVTPKPVRTEVVIPVPQEIKVVGKQEAASEKKTEEMTDVTRTRGGQNIEEHPLVIIDGVEQTDKEILSKLDPQTIESISVLKDATAAIKYGDKARDGVIIVVTKDGLLKGLK